MSTYSVRTYSLSFIWESVQKDKSNGMNYAFVYLRALPWLFSFHWQPAVRGGTPQIS